MASLALSDRNEGRSPEPVSDSGGEGGTDSDAPPQRERKQRKKVGHYNKSLSEVDRLEALRLHISESKTAAEIVASFAARGIPVAVNTLYTLFSKQAKGLPITPKARTRRTKYTDADKQLVVQAQAEHNGWTYDQLKEAWQQANPDKRGGPQP